MGEELKRCPFCGGRAVIAKEMSLFSVGCMLCGANVGATINKETAIKAWNRRKDEGKTNVEE